MNGAFYRIANPANPDTAGTAPLPGAFTGDYELDFPGIRHFDLYSEPIETLYSQVPWAPYKPAPAAAAEYATLTASTRRRCSGK